MKVEAKYDLIIAGGGMSGLSLAWYLAKGGYSGQVLVVDSTFAPINEKTWCFWTKETPPFKEIIYRTWNKAFFSALDLNAFLYLKDYSYHAIRCGDFKELVLTELKKHSNFDLLEENILDMTSNSKKAVLLTKNSDSYVADHIFQSIFKPNWKQPKYPLIQHFLGFEIDTEHSVFDPATFTIMDFDESFQEGVAFMYVLPFSHNKALLEFTVFSDSVLEKDFYENKIHQYMDKKFGLHISEYSVQRTEYGEIPMQDLDHQPVYENNIFNLGTMGGFTKPSTGYTFLRTQEYTKKLADTIISGNDPLQPTQSKFRYRYYDLLLLHILSSSTKESIQIFRDLFKKNSFDDVLRFLSEDSSVAQDLKIMSSVPSLPFLKAIGNNLIK
ncbi:MAG: lycopene cyclase family protein [Balneola sp.]